MSRVYDCFPFFKELDILEIRLRELSDQILPPWLATYIANSRRVQTPSLSKVLRK